ncbi:MAG TPA: transposase [Bryobacteraceae bacterium]|nr:transposase [Bryobacteraceae bacterium]
MAMGRRRKRIRQEQLWTATAALPVSASHPFYQKLNQILDEKHFDEFVEALCERFYAETMGRPGLAPGIYFRLLMVGYFEGIDAERGIAWRASDSLSIRSFVRIALDEAVPDHSTISRTRRLIDVETHQAVFQWVLRVLAEKNLLKGNTIGVDATTLEANAALRSIVRRDTGEQYDEFLKRLARESGIETPTREQLAHLDRKRKKKGSNDDWQHPQDPDARITKMKDGRTHLAHKAEHAVDMETGAIVAVTVQPADEGDTTTIVDTVAEAGERIAETAAETNNEAVGERVNPEGPSEIVTDKGYHSRKVVSDLTDAGVRTYCSEPARGRQKWPEQQREQQAVYANRRRIRGERGKRLLRQRGEKLERWNEHLYDRGGMRRVHLRGRRNILKRLVVHAGAANLGLLMRKLFGAGTPKALRNQCGRVFFAVTALSWLLPPLSGLEIHRWARALCSLLPAATATSALNPRLKIATCTTRC